MWGNYTCNKELVCCDNSDNVHNSHLPHAHIAIHILMHIVYPTPPNPHTHQTRAKLWVSSSLPGDTPLTSIYIHYPKVPTPFSGSALGQLSSSSSPSTLRPHLWHCCLCPEACLLWSPFDCEQGSSCGLWLNKHTAWEIWWLLITLLSEWLTEWINDT